jgi:hypothetical protein
MHETNALKVLVRSAPEQFGYLPALFIVTDVIFNLRTVDAPALRGFV